MIDSDRTALVALSAIPTIGPRRLRSIVEHHRPAEAFELLASGRRLKPVVETEALRPTFDALRARAAQLDVPELIERCATTGVEIVVPGDEHFPGALVGDPDPPSVLFMLGRPELLTLRSVGVIGTRNATAAGRATAFELSAALAEAEVAVVSGLARGIDGAAHRGVRSAADGVAGGAIAVVANGLDVAYPRQNADVWQWVSQHGLLISEWPPGTQPDTWRFPQRNRIIAGLSEVLVVVESRERGGSLITALAALDRGVTVMAVPGSPRNPASTGANQLLVDGAAPVTCVDDVLMALGLDHSRTRPTTAVVMREFEPVESAVLAACFERPCTLDMLVTDLGFTIAEVSAAASHLELVGHLADTSGWFEAVGSRLMGSGADGL